jgi:hypothetical protein
MGDERRNLLYHVQFVCRCLEFEKKKNRKTGVVSPPFPSSLLAGKYLENQPQKLVAAVGNILRKNKGTAAPISEEGSRNRLEINMFRVTAENKDATASHATAAA